MTHDPRFVNTMNGACWERRAVTSLGRGLYAAAGSCKCPEFLLVPLSELAELGITGSADALPMPVVPEPQALSETRLAEIEARAAAATAGPWCTDSWEIYQGTEYVPGISFWIGETCRDTSELGQDRADAAFVAAARSDVPALVAEVRRQAAQIAELEALTPAAIQTCRVCGAGYTYGEPCNACLFKARMAAETASLREPEGEHFASVHHSYRLGHDLPETGGPQ